MLAGCEDPRAAAAERSADTGAPVRITTSDGLELSARLFERDRKRVVIYLHEYRRDQSTWWPEAAQPLAEDASAITLDFRGHGESPGRASDVEALTRDVDAAITFARDRGYTRVLLVGVGMGGTLAMAAAADERDIALLGISVPTEFADVRALAVAPAFEGRLALIASHDDLSARDSLEQLSHAARVPPERLLVSRGRVHGVVMLRGESGDLVRPFFECAVRELLPR